MIKFIRCYGICDLDRQKIDAISDAYSCEDSDVVLVTTEEAYHKASEFLDKCIDCENESIQEYLEDVWCNDDYEICGVYGCYGDHSEDAAEIIEVLLEKNEIDLNNWTEEFTKVVRSCVGEYIARQVKEKLKEYEGSEHLEIVKHL